MWPKSDMSGFLVVLALAGMAALLLFVASDTLVYIVKTGVRKLVLTYRRMGRTRFAAATAAWALWGGGYLYLSFHTVWRHTLAAHAVGRGAYFVMLAESPLLLREGTLASYTLFVWLWVLPPAVVILSLWHVPRKVAKSVRRRKRT